MKAVATMRRVPPQAWLFVAALIARLAAWPFSDVVDADAVTRALCGESYMRYPGWVGTGVWPPLHIYLSGAFTFICGDRTIGSVLVNILLGSAIVFPVFAFVRRWSGTHIAVAVSLIVVFDALLFRNSLQGLSEIPFFFLTACAFNALAIAQTDPGRRGARQALVAGVFLTLACGMRYEAWLLVFPLTVFLGLTQRWGRTIVFLLVALAFPITWMITCHLAYGNMFSGFEQIVHWKSPATPVVASEADMFLRGVFFPLSLLLACTPGLVLLAFAGTSRALLRKELGGDRWPWLLLFPCFLALMIMKARAAELLLQHRFTMTLILLFVPYMALGLALLKRRVVLHACAILVAAWSMIGSMRSGPPVWLTLASRGTSLAAPVEFIGRYTKHETRAIPALEHRLSDSLVDAINAVQMEHKLVVLDFFGWPDTYNTGFRSDAFASSVVFLSPGEHQCGAALQRFQDYLDRLRDPQGVIALDMEGPCAEAAILDDRPSVKLRLPRDVLELRPIGKVGTIRLFTFRRTLGVGDRGAMIGAQGR